MLKTEIAKAKHNAPLKYEAAWLRFAEFRDVFALTELYKQARPHLRETPASVQGWLEHGGALLLENTDGKILSALRWCEIPEGWQLDRIATLPKHRTQGFGRWLMTKVEALAIRQNIASLHLSIEAEREDLLSYYGRMGYEQLGKSGKEILLSKRVGGTWQYKH